MQLCPAHFMEKQFKNPEKNIFSGCLSVSLAPTSNVLRSLQIPHHLGKLSPLYSFFLKFDGKSWENIKKILFRPANGVQSTSSIAEITLGPN